MTDRGPDRVPFLTELRRRGVLRVAASYGAIAWLLIQIGGAVVEPLDLPRWVLRALIVTAALGFPIAVALAWFLEFTPWGVAVDRQEAGGQRPGVRGLRRYADLAVIGILLLAVGYLLARQPDSVGLGGKATVAVLPFENLSAASDGEVLALGIAESVLHQLANLGQIDVISRTSSFAFRGRAEDAREIGRQLKAGFLLEGSVQGDRTRLRITTQLIDARTGADIWSMRFDRPPSDIFAVQDEIALQVTRALELTLDKDAAERMKGQGTEHLDAYLSYLQGRTLLASDRVADVKLAIEQMQRAIALDPGFSAGLVGLAEAELFVAEYDVTEDRETRFQNALDRGETLIDRALALDPDNGEAYLVRASMVAFTDLAAAEADYRRGLELIPNAAKGYAGLAAVLYETPSRRDEAWEMLDRARKLDPLQPAYDVTKAVFLWYERGDLRSASDLLAEVLRRNPDYVPALVRMSAVVGSMGRVAEAIEYGEHALSRDPMSADVRQELVTFYLMVDDVSAAEGLVDSAEHELSVRRLPILLYRHDWKRAGDAAYDSVARQTVSPRDVGYAVSAIRMHARTTGDFDRARVALEAMSGVRWDSANHPELPDRPTTREAAIGLADVLLAGGRDERGHQLLDVILKRMRHEVQDEGRSELWYAKWHPVALVLNGEHDEALAMLERSMDYQFGLYAGWLFLDLEPAYEGLRQDPRFQELLRAVRANSAEQRRELDRMRADGRVRIRGDARANAS